MRLLIVDGLNIGVRRFFAMGGVGQLPDIGSDTGQKFLQDVARETVSSIKARMKIDGYDDVRIAFESPMGKTLWRYDVYPDYKHATKEDRPRVGQALQPVLIEALREKKYTCLQALYMEADDVIATMVEKAQAWLEEKENELHIWSNDSDLWQLLQPSVVILSEGKQDDNGDILKVTQEHAESDLGISVAAIPLYKALVGDKSDNLRGVEGIGPKRAAKIIRRAPYRRPIPFIACPKAAGSELASLLLSKQVQIRRDTQLAALVSSAKLVAIP